MTLAELYALTELLDSNGRLSGVWACVPLCAVRLGLPIEDVWAMDAVEAFDHLAQWLPDLVTKEKAAELQTALAAAPAAFSPQSLQKRLGLV